VFYETNNTELY